MARAHTPQRHHAAASARGLCSLQAFGSGLGGRRLGATRALGSAATAAAAIGPVGHATIIAAIAAIATTATTAAVATILATAALTTATAAAIGVVVAIDEDRDGQLVHETLAVHAFEEGLPLALLVLRERPKGVHA